MSRPTIVCILGMHRSGTSLVARVMNVLGVYLGPGEHLMRPSADNPAGHWESRPIKEINDDILSRLGGSWSQPPALPAGWERSPALAGPRQRAREVIEGDFSGCDLWGFKDPRNSLTLPFWQRILDPMRYVICLRNPLDVAASARARNDDTVPFDQGVELWLTYLRASLAATAGHPRQLVFYEDLMADPEPVVRDLARFIGSDRSQAAKAETGAAVEVAVADSLWHHRTAVHDVVDAHRLPFHVKAFYVALRQFVPGNEEVGAEALDLLGAYAADAGDQQAKLDVTQAELEEAREHSGALKRRSVALEQRLAERGVELERAGSEREEAMRLQGLHEAELKQVAEERDEEQRMRRRLEAELEASRREVNLLQASAQSEVPDPERGPATPLRPEYDRLVAEVQARAAELVPSGATVLVAGKGDDALLRLEGSRGWHFPIAADGRYAGSHPSGDTAVIAQLEALRARGADHLLLPATTLWWLEHYQGLRHHLEDRYKPLLEDEVCAIYRLTAPDRKRAGEPISTLKRVVATLRVRSGRTPSILDWGTALGIAEHLPELPVFSPPGEEPVLPYLDGTADVVVLGSADAARLPEARRVAAGAVVRVDPSSERAELEWLAEGARGWGEDVSVTILAGADGTPLDATVAACAETLSEGFAGELSIVGDREALGVAGEPASAAGLAVGSVEVPAGAGLPRRARAAAEASDRPLQVFVTAPAVPLPDWLPSMLALLGHDGGAGVVGARTLSNLGALQEAGGVIAADGRRERRGEGDANPDRPEYCYVQRVDFCSPPLLATRRELFERLGGFDQGPLSPADAMVDFSLRAGQAGAPVYYQPRARVVAIRNGDR